MPVALAIPDLQVEEDEEAVSNQVARILEQVTIGAANLNGQLNTQPQGIPFEHMTYVDGKFGVREMKKTTLPEYLSGQILAMLWDFDEVPDEILSYAAEITHIAAQIQEILSEYTEWGEYERLEWSEELQSNVYRKYKAFIVPPKLADMVRDMVMQLQPELERIHQLQCELSYSYAEEAYPMFSRYDPLAQAPISSSARSHYETLMNLTGTLRGSLISWIMFACDRHGIANVDDLFSVEHKKRVEA